MKHRTSLNGRTATLETVCRPEFASPRRVVELGAHSLKIHRPNLGRIRTRKHPYALGHEVYAWGRISEPTIRQVVDILRQNALQPDAVIATSAVRDAQNRHAFIRLLEGELGVSIHVLSSWEEASLLVAGYLAHSSRLPALVVDVGGGSVELAFLNTSRTILWDSLPLGAIRLYHRGLRGGPEGQLDWIEREFRSASIVHADHIYATGGTVKTVAAILEQRCFRREDLGRLEARVRANGPPRDLCPSRAKVLLPGLLLLCSLVDFVGAETVTYLDISIGRVYLSPFHGRRQGRADSGPADTGQTTFRIV